MAHYHVGPAYVLIGDPTQGSGAGMTNLGNVESVTFDGGARSTWTSDARRAGIPLVDGVYRMPPAPVVQLSLKDAQVTMLTEFLYGSSVASSETLSPGSDFAKVAAASVSTLVIVPFFQKADGATADNAIWVPGVLITQLNGFVYNRPSVNAETNNPYNVEFQGVYREEDQTSGTPVAIPDGARMWFVGDPTNLSLSWSLPTLS